MFDEELNLDLTDTKAASFEAVPEGFYNVICMQAEVKKTKKEDGKYIKLELRLVDGDYVGRKVFTNFNIVNHNQQAEQIGKSQFKAFLEAAKHPNPNKPTLPTLIGLEVKAKLGLEKGEDGEVRNVVKSYKPVDKSALTDSF